MGRGLSAALAFVAAVGVLGACTSTSTPAEQVPRPAVAEVRVPAVFAYATSTAVRLVNDGRTVADTVLAKDEHVVDLEWTPDGRRLVVGTSARLMSFDSTTGASAVAECRCDSVAVAGQSVYVAEGYGATELRRHDLVTLADPAVVEPELDGARGVLSIDGAGDRVVLYRITADGARPITDVVVLDPATGKSTVVGGTGDIGAPTGGVYTPRGWDGKPAFAYLANGSTGAQTGTGSVVWFDPTGADQQTVANDRHLRYDVPPMLPSDRFNTGRDHLHWSADGLRTTAWTWGCQDAPSALDPPRCFDLLPRQQWRFDGSDWSRADDRDLASVRTLADGAVLELAHDKQLTLVTGEIRTAVAGEVARLSSPSLPGPAVSRGSAELAERFAPRVRIHPEEKNFPSDASEFVGRSRLRFYHEGVCQTEVAERVDEAELGRGRYTNPNDPARGCGYSAIGRTYRSDEWALEDGKRVGFVLDLDDDARAGHEPVDGTVSAPVYWEYVAGPRPGLGAYVYWLFYAYNDFNNTHEADWEKVAVQVDGDRPVAVAFWKHSVPACQVPWEDMGTSDGHPVTYAARGSHGSYPQPGEFARYDGQQLGTDHTSDKGSSWPTWEDVRHTRDQPWYGYRGLWGDVLPVDVPLGDKFEGIGGPNAKRDLSAALTGDRCEPRETPKSLAGKWKSSAPVQDPMGAQDPRAANYTVEVELTEGPVGAVVGRVGFPGLGCRATWTLTQASAESLVVREDREPDGDQPNEQCRATGNAVVTRTPAGLRYSFQPDRRPGPATAELVRG